LRNKIILIAITILLMFSVNKSAYASYPDTNIRTIAVGSAPTSVAITTDYLFVSNSFDDTVSVIDLVTYANNTTIDVGKKPEHLIASSDKSKVYVSNYDDDSISIIDVATLTVSGTIGSIGDGPAGMCLSGSGDKLYVACALGDTVAVVTTSDDRAVHNFSSVGSGPYGVAASSDGNYLYVTLNSESSVALIDLTTNTVSDTRVAVGSGPKGIAMTPNGNYAYAANLTSDSLSNISTSSKLVVNTISNVGDGAHSIAITDNGEFAIVSNSNSSNVSVVDLINNTLIETITVESTPYGICLSADETLAFVANRGNNSVTVLEDQSKIVYESIDLHYLNNVATAQIVWHTTDSGTYQIEVGGTGTKGTGTVIYSGAVTALAPMTTDIVAATHLTNGDGAYKIYFYLTAVSDYVDYTTLVLDNSVPAVPFGLISGFGDGAVYLSWDATTDSDLEGYNIYYGTATGVYGAPVTIGVLETYTLSGLTNGTEYFIALTAVDITGNESAYSLEVTETPDRILGLSELAGENSCFIATASYDDHDKNSLITRLIDSIFRSGE